MSATAGHNDLMTAGDARTLRVVILLRHLKRHGTTVRALLALLAMALVLNGIAYLTHRHKVEKIGGSVLHTELCSYCATFGALGGANADLPSFQTPAPLPLLIALLVAAPLLRRHVTSARPRAPTAR